MFRRDYLMRQIEQLTVVLHRILFQKEHLPIEDAQRQLDEASRHLLGLNIRSLQALSSKDIVELLTYQGNLDTAKALVISDMLVGQGDLLQKHGENGEAYWAYLKSLDLLLHVSVHDEVEPHEEINEEIDSRLRTSLAYLQGWAIPAGVQRLLFTHYEKIGQYAKAEDALFHFMEDHPDERDVPRQGLLFYEKLLQVEDEQLIAGNFSREEVIEGLTIMKQKMQL
ncbi:DUF6483 family protein [Paenibacillus roseipurpureus]|uniref:DUF6483 family protein n=1 Tax=Paenibacillus roseopurpureus TaxID=2918901 RepID=A0AA96RLV0_9BACL|nr:DUF6483 family protein [Paenibacillus sp. MBLB1832]WNR45799.1 DUF6483 family protein [Paenibacillus sp. MBLB1832]